MDDRKTYGALDWFRLAAALLVVAIHTSPLGSFSAGADFFLTRVAARVAVPFFFLTAGQFVLGKNGGRGVIPYVKKLGILYAAAIALYLPLGLYAGHYRGIGVRGALRLLLFDGTFYHLWYFPACILGILLCRGLVRYLPEWGAWVIAGALYLVGLGGDSYYGLMSAVPPLGTLYGWGFHLFSYTRNGLFFAPLFLLLGRRANTAPRRGSAGALAAGAAVFLALMTAEAFTLRHFALQRHDSMYLFLPGLLWCLYRLLLCLPGEGAPGLRRCAAWIYLLHPWWIVLVRLGAKKLGLAALLVDNSLGHYLAVCALSLASGAALARLEMRFRSAPDPRGRAWAELSRSALAHNVRTLEGLLPAGCRLMPAVKANAYGHGAVAVGRMLNGLGVRSFCVASAAEGAALRRGGVRGEILVLGYTHPTDVPLLRRYRLSQTVLDCGYARMLEECGGRVRVHIGVDTGMHRLGETYNHIEEIVRMLESRALRVEGIFTHLCVSDEDAPAAREFTRRQAAAFEGLCEQLAARGYPDLRRHLCASYGIVNQVAARQDLARAGIALYGVLSEPGDRARGEALLRPVLTLKARVAAVRTLAPEERAGYGLAFTARRETVLATLAIGYADGVPRSLSCGVGEVLLAGRRARIVGRICMDQLLVDATEVPTVRPGDEAVLLGGDGDERITAYDWAKWSGSITNEVLSRLGARLGRIETE